LNKYIKIVLYIKVFTWRLKTYILAMKNRLILIDFFDPHMLDFEEEELTTISDSQDGIHCKSLG
jgi:hypothetical protein